MNKEHKKGLVPKFRFKEFSGEWKVRRFGDIATFSKGKGISKADIDENGKTFCIRYGELYTEYSETIYKVKSKTNIPVDNLVLSEANDVIIPASGETQIDIATASCVKVSGVALGGDLNIIKSKENGVFLTYYLNNQKKLEIAKLAQGISVVHLYSSQLKLLTLNLPEEKEQTKIAACLSSLDDLITSQTQKIEALKTHKKGLMQQLFPQEGETVPKLRFPEFIDSGEWEEKTVGQISRNVTAGGTPSTSEKSYWGGNIKWMNSGELNNKKVYEVQGRITEEGLRNSSTKFIPKHSVLIGLAGQGKTRGTVAMNMVEVCINQSIAAIFPNDEKFFSNFLYHNLDNRYDELRRLSAGGEGRGGLNLQIIKSLIIHLPKLKEQTKIANCLSSLDDLINAQVKKCELLKTHKKGLMQGLFPSSNEEDYTKSRQNLDTSETIEEISKKAMMLRNHDQ